MNFESLFNQGKFPKTKSYLFELSNAAKKSWELNILSAKPSFWGKMALSNKSGGGGGLLIIPIAGGFRVYHPNKGKYNYLKVLEKGRARYDMKEAILSGPRAKIGENGRYSIIPFTKNENGTLFSPITNEINSVIIKTGSYKSENPSGKMVSRNTYEYRQDPSMTGKGNVFASDQIYRNGVIHRSFVKFVTISEKSRPMYYPRISPHPMLPNIKKEIARELKSERFKQVVREDSANLVFQIFNKKKPR